MDSRCPLSPTQSLPRLAQLARTPALEVKKALDQLCALYFSHILRTPLISTVIFTNNSSIASTTLNNLNLRTTARPLKISANRHKFGTATPVPDSGYASAEEDDSSLPEECEIGEEDTLSSLRADPFERAYALKWLTGFIGRSDIWLSYSSADEDDDSTLRAELLEEAARLVNAFSEGTTSPDPATEEDGSIVRSFSFSTPSPGYNPTPAATQIPVQLNDAPLSTSDHTSVGLQSWGSSIILAERICSDPFAFSLLTRRDRLVPSPLGDNANAPLRILELGAGTGLLSITISKLMQLHLRPAEIMATDYHPDVLANLSLNVSANFRPQSQVSKLNLANEVDAPFVSVHAFEWEHPDYLSPSFDEPFNVILAADVIYHPSHAAWIKNCVRQMLLMPGERNRGGGVFWLMIPLRTTGRHDGLHCTVENTFLTAGSDECGTTDDICGFELAVLELEEVPRRDGVGRADESGYRLYKIGWAPRI